MPYVNVEELIVKAAISRGWKQSGQNLVKRMRLDRVEEMMGMPVADVSKLMKEELESQESVDVGSLTDLALAILDKIEGSFVLMSMGYKIYEEDK